MECRTSWLYLVLVFLGCLRPDEPQRGDPFKAQGAQPCKGDQTLGKMK